MIFYEIEMLSVPQIEFACSVEYDKYGKHFYNRCDFLEICVGESGRILFKHSDGREEILEPRRLSPIVSDMCCETSAYQGEQQKHTTVGVKMQYRAVRYCSAEECDLDALRVRMAKGNTVLIPYQERLEERFEEILSSIKKIAALFFSAHPHDKVCALSQWYALCAKLTEFVYTRLSEAKLALPPSERMYVARAERYISEHYESRLSVGEIATNLGISEGYLHRIFKRVKGMGVIEYINRHRVSVALELMQIKGLTLAEASSNVGVEDPSYMSRLFKKILGMNCREYLNRECAKIK